jgi:hypothetical protein
MGKMTDEAKENMAMGMKAMRAVEAYLTFIDQHKPRGKKVDRALLEEKIKEEKRLAHKVILIAQMHEAVRREEWAAEEAPLEDAFIKYAPWFSEQHGIQYAAWREMGVQVQVLGKAGITG